MLSESIEFIYIKSVEHKHHHKNISGGVTLWPYNVTQWIIIGHMTLLHYPTLVGTSNFQVPTMHSLLQMHFKYSHTRIRCASYRHLTGANRHGLG